jgi:hypothetical protein
MVRFADPPDPLSRDFPLGDGVADSLAHASCPYCGESVEIVVDPGGGARQEYVEDCPVCCRPWRVTVRYSGGEPVVELRTEDDG